MLSRTGFIQKGIAMKNLTFMLVFVVILLKDNAGESEVGMPTGKKHQYRIGRVSFIVEAIYDNKDGVRCPNESKIYLSRKTLT